MCATAFSRVLERPGQTREREKERRFGSSSPTTVTDTRARVKQKQTFSRIAALQPYQINR